MYKIIRFHFNHDQRNTTRVTGLTLEEAQAHCRDPETSSSTCKRADNVAYTERHGEWFDGYTDEE